MFEHDKQLLSATNIHTLLNSQMIKLKKKSYYKFIVLGWNHNNNNLLQTIYATR
jgi:hypothetical protein